MILITLLSVIASFLLVTFNVSPPELQIISFAISAILFIIVLFKNLPNTTNLKKKFHQKGIIFTLILSVILTNFLTRHFEYIFDFSKDKITTFRPETIEWIKKIDLPVQILVFLKSDDKTATSVEWIKKEFSKNSQRVSFEIKNINRDITLAKKYNITQIGQTVIISGDQWITIPDYKEQSLLRGLIKILSNKNLKICFVTGHGEADLENTFAEGLSQLKALLIDLGYHLESIDLSTLALTSSNDQDTCALYVAISSKTPYFPQEAEKFQTIFNSSKPLLLALETPFSENLDLLLTTSGLKPTKQLIVNRENLSQKIPITDIITHHFSSHPVLDPLNKPLFLPEVQALEITSENWKPLLQTPPANNLYLLNSSSKDPEATHIFTMAALQENTSRKIMMGTGKIFTNRYIQYGDNQNFFINLIRWLLKEESTTEQPGRVDTQEEVMNITPRLQQIVKYFCFYIFPGTSLLALGAIWIIRNKRSL